MGFADFDIMGKCKTIIEKVEEVATNLSEVKTFASGAKTSADDAKASAATAVSNTSVIGATGNTGGSTTAGTVMGKLNALLTNWTSTRAGYIDNIRSYTITNNTASKTGVLSAKLAYVISLLENTTYGLSAIKTKLNGGVTASVGTIKGYIETTYATTGIYAYFYKVYTSGSNTVESGTVIWSLSNVFVYPKVLTADREYTTTLYFSFGYGTGKFQVTVDEYTRTVELSQYDYVYVEIPLPLGMKISKIELKVISKVTMNNSHCIYAQPKNSGLGLVQL